MSQFVVRAQNVEMSDSRQVDFPATWFVRDGSR